MKNGDKNKSVVFIILFSVSAKATLLSYTHYCTQISEIAQRTNTGPAQSLYGALS